MTNSPALRRLTRAGVAVALGAVLLVLPLVNSPYQVERFSRSIVLALAVLGLVVLTGWSGQISLGHGALFGIGAYTSALLVVDAGWPQPVTVLVAAAAGLLCGAVAGLPALRVSGIYLALVSLTMATVFPTAIQHFASVTGGTQGLSVPAFTSWFPSLAPDQWGYYVALAIAAPLFLLVHNLGRSRVGRALRAARDNEIAATAMGVPVARYKIVAFAVSGGLTAVAGSLFILIQPFPYLDSRSFTIALSISLVTGLVVGGARSVAGAALAGLFLDRAPSLVEGVAHLDGSATNVFYGGLLVLLMFVLPGGIAGVLPALRGRRRRRPLPSQPADVLIPGGDVTEPESDSAPVFADR
jgi:branched-chain amino acid transport system permease protein